MTGTILRLALRSLWNRRVTALLTVFSIAISVALLLGVDRVRTEARASFSNTISGTDLIVGARSGDINLLLYSVFRIGNATANISWESFQDIASRREVAWTIPISLGDSHRGFRVMGTNHDYFEHYRFARDRKITFAEGRRFEDLFDAVMGADVARTLGYELGEQIIIAHGIGAVSFLQHDDKPFTITGILERTGTPIDRTVHVSLEAIEAIHIDWQQGAPPMPGRQIPAEEVRQMDLQPTEITAFLVGLQSRMAIFNLQRFINSYRPEALSAVIPGVALQQLWELVGVVEVALLAISAFVVLAGLLGMLTAILTSLNERRREMAILRSVGARPWQLFALMVMEAVVLAAVGVLAGFAILYALLLAAAPLIGNAFGVFISIAAPGSWDAMIAGLVVGAAFVIGLFPAFRAYRNALSDGLTIRV
ncbi:MAG: ABC transporter permease [Chromatiales bacterium]|nr:ABC transporter permease [Chromatiales bacterium]